MIYLDWAATAPLEHACMEEALQLGREAFGNPSSQHPAGRRGRELLEASRASLASSLGCAPGELVLSSGATESNAIVIFSLLSRLRGRGRSPLRVSVVASGIEHPSIYDNLQALEGLGIRVSFVGARRAGAVRPDDVVECLDPETAMVLLMWVNNVTGAIQPVAELAAAVRRYSAEHGRKIIVHTDAVQALFKVPLDLHAAGVDSASFSAHKIGGPRGVGALYVREGTSLEPFWRGEQERGWRAGTENCVGAAAFAAVARARRADAEREGAHAALLAGMLRREVARIPGCALLPSERAEEAAEAGFSPFILSAAFPPIPSEILVRVLAAEGICVSSGSACASRSREKRERVYRSIGLPATLARSAIRISTGPLSSEREVSRLVEVLEREVPRLARIAR